MTLEEIHALLSKTLDFQAFKDIDTINGIQVANASPSKKNIARIAVAVDASVPIINAAATHNVDLLVVHHGLFWGHTAPITQAMHTKLQALIAHDIALYAVHLPLDAHIPLGNNAQLARKIGLKNCKPCAMHKGTPIGVCGQLTRALSPHAIIKKLFAYPNSPTTNQNACIPYATPYGLISHAVASTSENTQASTLPRPLSLALHGAPMVQKVAVVSGSGHAFLDEVHAQGADMLITGDASHIAALRAEELGMHVLSAGHYFTEIWGPLALGAHLQKAYARRAKGKKTETVEVLFLDKPTEH